MNPLLQAMNGRSRNQAIDMLRNLKNGNPEQIAKQMMIKNPQFKAFMDANNGKSPEQVAQEHGIDINQIIKMMK